MTVPDYQSLMTPVLEVLDSVGRQQFRELVELVADAVGLSDEDRAATVSSGEPLIRNRVGWSLTYLARAGAVRRPRRGIAEITDRGRALLGAGPSPVTNHELDAFEEFRAFRSRAKGKQESEGVTRRTDSVAPDDAGEAPAELIQRAVAETRAVVEGELLDRVLLLDPTMFERLVLRLLTAMGYGESGSVEHSGKPGDGGIDGIISQDPLGLDCVYMQAKRYAQDHPVGRPAIQEFVGALHGVQADRGVFICTSTFTAGARDYAERVNARVILIDGERLAALMVRHGVGVQTETTVTLHRLDEDFFESL